MRIRQSPATRSALVRLRRRKERISTGGALLRRKREALVSELFRAARPALDSRRVMSEEATTAFASLLEATTVHGEFGLETFGWPVRNPPLEIRATQAWGIPIAEVIDRPVLARSVAKSGLSPGAVGPAAAETATHFEQLAELLLDAAPKESLLRRLGDALMRTSRQLNTLEHRLEPATQREIVHVRRRLEENEREDNIRLRHLLRRLHDHPR